MTRTMPSTAQPCTNHTCPHSWHIVGNNCPYDMATDGTLSATAYGLPPLTDESDDDRSTRDVDSIRRLICYDGDIEPEFWDSDIAQTLFAELPADAPTSELAMRWEQGYYRYQGICGWNYERWGEPRLPDSVVDQVSYEVGGGALIDAMEREYRVLCHNYGRPLVARTRTVWFDAPRNRVIKMATGDEGLMSNSREIALSGETDSWIPMATTTTFALPEGDMGQDVSSGMCVESEMVEPVHFRYGDPNEPDWVGTIDGGQVGINREGELVAYDL